MSNPEPNEVDRGVDASMRMFEKSKVGDSAALVPIKPARVLLVLDGSPQDETGIESANYLRETFNVETLVLDGRESDDGQQLEDIAGPVIERVSGSRPITPPENDGDAHDIILAALGAHSVDLVILPCPFGREFESIGTDSAGTVIDVMLSRCPRPMLVIRRDDQALSECVFLDLGRRRWRMRRRGQSGIMGIRAFRQIRRGHSEFGCRKRTIRKHPIHRRSAIARKEA